MRTSLTFDLSLRPWTRGSVFVSLSDEQCTFFGIRPTKIGGCVDATFAVLTNNGSQSIPGTRRTAGLHPRLQYRSTSVQPVIRLDRDSGERAGTDAMGTCPALRQGHIRDFRIRSTPRAVPIHATLPLPNRGLWIAFERKMGVGRICSDGQME